MRTCAHLGPFGRARLIRREEAACARLLAQTSAWQPFELKVICKSERRQRLGLLLGLQTGTESSLACEMQEAGLQVPAQTILRAV